MMQDNPIVLLLGVFFALFLGGRGWRRRKLKRAVRDLPTRLQRMIGEEPGFEPPAEVPEGLQGYVALYGRSARVMYGIWALAFGWLGYVIYLWLGTMG
ncbi:hypothetical protein [Tropicibacter naphthalenivorans]|uniref:Uncharacterized protein n=1 Tax=Tropicibacter naphthalenivorans TaxID=441103 RepID=A0A0P1GAL8_9RHOB|nr:hypothetical protein [Tropicibacter naphthalenivorans]CUH78503.1 hypothetical protein TRN7648_02008 [Tropicibacter naphthalenivorans]SMC80798.1 hypothetical protein SAMN04488093_104170 [Tropicibacter naphthalenivorans]